MTRLQLLGGLVITLMIVAIGVSYAVNRPARIRQHAAQHSHQDAAQSFGAISGRVLDPEGQPVFGAEVNASHTESGTGRVPTAYTDNQGEFQIRDLRPGTYIVSASKEEDGYARTYLLFNSAGFVENPQVTVYEQQITSDVVVHLGPRAARLVGRIVNAITNEPIQNLQNVKITFRRIDRPDNWYSRAPDLNGEFSIFVPPAPFTIEVEAPGYEDWQYRSVSAGDQTASLQLVPGSSQNLTIALRPLR